MTLNLQLQDDTANYHIRSPSRYEAFVRGHSDFKVVRANVDKPISSCAAIGLRCIAYDLPSRCRADAYVIPATSWGIETPRNTAGQACNHWGGGGSLICVPSRQVPVLVYERPASMYLALLLSQRVPALTFLFTQLYSSNDSTNKTYLRVEMMRFFCTCFFILYFKILFSNSAKNTEII